MVKFTTDTEKTLCDQNIERIIFYYIFFSWYCRFAEYYTNIYILYINYLHRLKYSHPHYCINNQKVSKPQKDLYKVENLFFQNDIFQNENTKYSMKV